MNRIFKIENYIKNIINDKYKPKSFIISVNINYNISVLSYMDSTISLFKKEESAQRITLSIIRDFI